MPTTTPQPCCCDGRYRGCDHITQNLEAIKAELVTRSGVTR